MILAYTNSDTTASVVIGIIALAIGIAMLVEKFCRIRTVFLAFS